MSIQQRDRAIAENAIITDQESIARSCATQSDRRIGARDSRSDELDGQYKEDVLNDTVPPGYWLQNSKEER